MHSHPPNGTGGGGGRGAGNDRVGYGPLAMALAQKPYMTREKLMIVLSEYYRAQSALKTPGEESSPFRCVAILIIQHRFERETYSGKNL